MFSKTMRVLCLNWFQVFTEFSKATELGLLDNLVVMFAANMLKWTEFIKYSAAAEGLLEIIDDLKV